jgi:hypothetical protein
MTNTKAGAASALGLTLGLAAAVGANAQGTTPAVLEQARTFLPDVEPPPREFATAEAHYRYLYEQADGGTEHTMATIPVWDGLWGSGNNTMPNIFLENGTLATAWSPGAKIKPGVLTPAYEQHFSERRAEIEQYGQQRYDRLTNCEYPGAALVVGALYQGVRQYAEADVADERLHERNPPHLHRRGARQYRRKAFGDGRQYRILGQRQTRDLDQVGKPCRLRARHASDQQPIRDGRNLAAKIRR